MCIDFTGIWWQCIHIGKYFYNCHNEVITVKAAEAR